MAAHGLEHREVALVAVLNGLRLDLHNFAEELRVGAVNHELHALARELVVDLLYVGLERQEPFTPGLVSHGTQKRSTCAAESC